MKRQGDEESCVISDKANRRYLKYWNRCFARDNEKVSEGLAEWQSIRCATELEEAGIKFVKIGFDSEGISNESNSLFDISYRNGTMKIPTFVVDDNTESLFRNLIAYELYSQGSTYVLDYVTLMDNLINSANDVKLLRLSGVIVNMLGDDEAVAQMINKLRDHVTLSGNSFYYEEIFFDVKKHCARRWNIWKAKLSHDYFNSPWALLSFLAALLIILLTIGSFVTSLLALVVSSWWSAVSCGGGGDIGGGAALSIFCQLAMAEAIVSVLVERLLDLLAHEAVFLQGVHEEVGRLVAELERMKSALKDADRRQEQDELSRTVEKQIRELAYDAEDVIDTYILKVANQNRFMTMLSKPFHLHTIGEQVRAILAKLEDISKTLQPYKLISGEGESSNSNSRQRLIRRTNSLATEGFVVSLEGITSEVLAQLMKEDDSLRVVSIVGMGGIGKTTLANKLYHHVDVTRHFDSFAWVFISQQCMEREVFHEILVKVLSPSKEYRELMDKMKETELMRTLRDVLEDKRYLVVLDDIWSSDQWNTLKHAFPPGKKGSKILFTTRIKDVPLLADPLSSPVELPFLTDGESWELFRRKAFPGDGAESSHACPDEEFEKLGKDMVGKCGGLPLAIVVLGGLLATKRSLAQWEMVQRRFNADLNKRLGDTQKKELIRLWIAEGFISPPPQESGELLMEDEAEQCLQELINRCLVQVGKKDSTGTGVKTCQIHDLLRDLCVKKAREDNFLGIIQPPSNVNNIGPRFRVNLAESTERRRIAIHPSKGGVFWKNNNVSYSSVQIGTFKAFCSRRPGFLLLSPPSFLYGYFEGVNIYLPPRDALKNIETLKYIRVDEKFMRNINAMLSLTNVQSLGLIFQRSTYVESIVKSLIELHRMRSLHMDFEIDFSAIPNLEPLSDCRRLTKLNLRGRIQEEDGPHSSHPVLKFLPHNITKLTLVASMLWVDPMAELGKLQHLRILRLGRKSYCGTKLVCSANGFPQLDYLELVYLHNLEEWVIEEGAMPRLRSFKLVDPHKLRMLPEGLRYITTLKEMSLQFVSESLAKRSQVIDGREGEDFYKVRHIPSIQIINW
ncbi:Disease resistance protein [Corchorus capsularis]|uniref:Disease resistance protein n=1 Tax=Corchorus capsularis TaxID=210143 RepID=A0A1R3FWH8_COCAP|nr:Disease resistance protein [Corchorus capsularis]